MEERRARVHIINACGLHARPATSLVNLVARHRSRVRFVDAVSGVEAIGDSMLSLLALGAALGTELEIVVEGEDSEELLGALVGLFESGFGEGAG